MGPGLQCDVSTSWVTYRGPFSPPSPPPPLLFTFTARGGGVAYFLCLPVYCGERRL